VEPGRLGHQSTAKAALAAAQFNGVIQRAQASRPGSIVTVTYQPATDTWLGIVHLPDSNVALASIVLSDGDLKVHRTKSTPLSQYPTYLTGLTAAHIAQKDPATKRALRAFGGLRHTTVCTTVPDQSRDQNWEVTFLPHAGADCGKGHPVVMDLVHDYFRTVAGPYTGFQIQWPMARGDRYAFGKDANKWYVFWPSFALFALVMLDLTGWRALRSWLTVDVLALLSFGASHEFFNRGQLAWSVPLAVPPLVYLFARMVWVFLRGVRPPQPAAELTAPASGEPAPDAPRPPAAWWRRWHLPTWLLLALAVFMLGARYGLDGYGSNVVDVGSAGEAGASALMHGVTPYGHIRDPANGETVDTKAGDVHGPLTGDTYGPLDYAAYVPAVEIWGDGFSTGHTAAHAVSIASDVLCVLALALIGWRWMSRRAAVLLVAGWATYPYTGWTLANNGNDLLVAALLLFALAALPRAWLRGGLIGVAAMVKFVPLLALAPLAHAGTRERRHQSVVTISAAMFVVFGCLFWVSSYPHGWERFLHATWDFQFHRDSPFSIWGYYAPRHVPFLTGDTVSNSWLRILQEMAQDALIFALALALVWPATRDFRQVAAGMAAAVLGVELVLQHWFYLYIPWFFGLVLVVLVAMRESRTLPPAQRVRDAPPKRQRERSEPPEAERILTT
jgi:hypothetical protein